MIAGNKKIIIYGVLTILGLGFQNGFCAGRCKKLLHEDPTQSGASRNSTELAMKILRSKGFDPARFAFRYYVNRGFYFGVDVEIRYGKTMVGRASAGTAGLLAPWISMGLVGVIDEFRGKGVGSMLYAIAAKLAYEDGYVLCKDDHHTRHAARLWKTLRKHGFATSKGEFIRSKLENDPTLESYYFFFMERAVLVKDEKKLAPIPFDSSDAD